MALAVPGLRGETSLLYKVKGSTEMSDAALVRARLRASAAMRWVQCTNQGRSALGRIEDDAVQVHESNLFDSLRRGPVVTGAVGTKSEKVRPLL